MTRRDFLRAGGVGLAASGLSRGGLNAQAAAGFSSERSVILLNLVGGPSQLETFDPKPNAPSEVRGPFGSIPTSCPTIRISEHLPRIATRMDRIALVRSVYHDAAPIHETGHQLLQTGRLCRVGDESPHFGSVVAKLDVTKRRFPSFVVLPGPIASTGVNISHGQSAGWLGAAYDPFHLAVDPGTPVFDLGRAFQRARAMLEERAHLAGGESESINGLCAAEADEPIPIRPADSSFDLGREPERVREAYGPTAFGQSCLMARRLVEAGVRVVTVNMFETVFGRVTWDCHGSAPFSTLADYASELLPTFDRAIAALVDDLERSGRLESTLVVAAGEFGRTPWINASGGRDHWPGVWSVALAGGGIQGGRVVGASDSHAGRPAERPVTLPALLATVYQSLGIDARTALAHPGGESRALVDVGEPIHELFE
jgi:hypothetical protein